MGKYETILVTTDFSEQAESGVAEAARLAHELACRLVLLYVVEDRMPPVLDTATWSAVMDQHQSIAQRRLKSYAAERLGDVPSETVVVAGRPHEEILRQATEHSADLIVMASHGYGLLGQALLGSTTERVLRHAEVPVLVVHSRKE